MAPALQPMSIPKICPIAISAIPTVAIVLHELPVASETIAQITQEAAKKILGFKISNP